MHAIKLRQIAAWLVVLSVATLTGTILSVTQTGVFFPFSWTADYQKVHYGITIDAGSHGTRAHLFSWSGRVENPQFPLLSPVTIPKHVAVVAPPNVTGLSEFIEDPASVGANILAPLIAGLQNGLAKLGVPTTDFATIRLYLKATAGMRNTDVDARDALMTAVRQWLGSTVNSPFAFQPDWARVISGEEEGTFGWIAVNNLLGSLFSPAALTVGALDLGGASAQITFMPTHTSVLEDHYELELGPRALRLYAHSFLGYGWDDAHRRVTTRLALEALFSALQNDTLITSTPLEDIDVVDLIRRGDLPRIRLVEPASSKRRDGGTQAESSATIAVLQADHPCFPRGAKIKFDLPSLLYPDGRTFLDIDLRAIIAYMKASGIDIESAIVRQHFPSDIFDKVIRKPLVDPLLPSVTVSRARNRPTKDRPPVTRRSERSDPFFPLVHVQPKPFKPFPHPIPPTKLQYRIKFSGTGDFYACQRRAVQLFYQEPCFLSTCSFNGIYQPRIAESKFLALGQFSKIHSILGIPETASPNTLAKGAVKLCASEWSSAKEFTQSPNETDVAALIPSTSKKMCWKALWAHAILTEGYGFDGDAQSLRFWTPPQFDAMKSDDDAESNAFPGWALGSMVAEITYFPWQNARGRFEAPFWWSLSACTCLTLLAIVQAKRVHGLIRKLHFFDTRRSDVYEDIDTR